MAGMSCFLGLRGYGVTEPIGTITASAAALPGAGGSVVFFALRAFLVVTPGSITRYERLFRVGGRVAGEHGGGSRRARWSAGSTPGASPVTGSAGRGGSRPRR